MLDRVRGLSNVAPHVIFHILGEGLDISNVLDPFLPIGVNSGVAKFVAAVAKVLEIFLRVIWLPLLALVLLLLVWLLLR